MSYQDYMAEGSSFLNSGRTKQALGCFSNAFLCDPTFEALQSKGIALRLLGEYDEAGCAFEEAFSLAKEDADKGRIVRDWGMVPFDQDDFDEARKFFLRSLQLLRNEVKVNVDVEIENTKGFLAEALIEEGRLARKMLRQAYKALRASGRKTEELNLLIRLLKAENAFRRFWFGPRAIYLAARDRHLIRVLEVLALCSGGRRLHAAATKIRKHFR